MGLQEVPDSSPNRDKKKKEKNKLPIKKKKKKVALSRLLNDIFLIDDKRCTFKAPKVGES